MKLHSNLILLSIYSTLTSSQTDIETDGAVAHFARNGIDGTVKVINGHIIMNLTFADNFDFDQIGGDNCFDGGMYFGIYDEWDYDSYDDKLGSTDCASKYTGKRFDPWKACSSASANEYCETYEDGCIPPSSYRWNADEYYYLCNDITYLTEPYLCEMGDLSGKYGLLQLDSDNNYRILKEYASAFEADSYDLGGKSLVFRCHDNKRAFCAPFEEYVPTDLEIENNPRRFQETFYSTDPSDDTSDNIYSQVALFGDSGRSYALLTYYGRYEIVIDSDDIGVPGNCGDEIYYRIFTNWDETGEDCEAKTSDLFYDPTLVCADNSENGDTNGKAYCEEDYYLCEDSKYEYKCSDYTTDAVNRLSCAPGDLSAKYGSIDITGNVNFYFNVSGYDPKMISMAKLKGKSLVLQCASDKGIIDCAPFLDYTDDAGYTNPNDIDIDSSEESVDDEESKKKKAANDNNLFGVSNTVVIVMFVLTLAAIVPCVKSCRNRKAGAATGVDDRMYDPNADRSKMVNGGSKQGIIGRFRDRVESRSTVNGHTHNNSHSHHTNGDRHSGHNVQRSYSGSNANSTNNGFHRSTSSGSRTAGTRRTLPSMQS